MSLVPSWPKKNSHWISLADWSCECRWEEDSEAEWQLEHWSPRGEEKVQYLWILSIVNPFSDWSCKWREWLWSRVTARTHHRQEDQGVKKRSSIYRLFQQILNVVNPFADWFAYGENDSEAEWWLEHLSCCQEDQGVKKRSNIYGLFQQILSVVNPFVDWSCKWGREKNDSEAEVIIGYVE